MKIIEQEWAIQWAIFTITIVDLDDSISELQQHRLYTDNIAEIDSSVLTQMCRNYYGTRSYRPTSHQFHQFLYLVMNILGLPSYFQASCHTACAPTQLGKQSHRTLSGEFLCGSVV